MTMARVEVVTSVQRPRRLGGGISGAINAHSASVVSLA
jgi:hypothetical protein